MSVHIQKLNQQNLSVHIQKKYLIFLFAKVGKALAEFSRMM